MNLIAHRLGLGSSTFSMSPFQGLGEAPKSLGQDEQVWYSRGKTAVAEYDNLWERAQKIARKEVHDDLQRKYHGDPNDKDGALYQRNSLDYTLAQAEANAQKTNYEAFGRRFGQNMVLRLEKWNDKFKPDVVVAETTYGTVPVGQFSGNTATTETSTLPSWAIPALVMSGLAVVGVLVAKSIK
jgi:hypothetical protein